MEKLRKQKKFLVEILAFCLMPNHIHLLVEQILNNGVSSFMSNFTNSYTRYFNNKRNRYGHIFQGKFKAVRVETDEQLLHASRYIHLNPYGSYLVKTYEELKQYPYSSFPEYLLPKISNFCNKKKVLSHFTRGQTYQKFVTNQADYQRKLEIIKHLLLEK